MFTTCRHGKRWREFAARVRDSRCDTDNEQFDHSAPDYIELMRKSDFCLIPRGRRLGSFRFLEALQLGCIPVVVSNDWVLPFDGLINWQRAVVLGDERLLLQIPEILRSIPPDRIAAMRRTGLELYEKYFSSVERIIGTTLAVLESRIAMTGSHSGPDSGSAHRTRHVKS